MPEQFGAMASLCFGCEGIFQNQRSRSVAEKVLIRLTGLFPKKPQVFFLQGKLRSALEQYEEAFAAYKKAIELDPDYIDALKEILSLRRTLKHLKNQMEPVMLKLLDMDPFQRHFSFDLQEITDLKAFFEVMEKHQKSGYEVPKKLFPLPRPEKVQKTEELSGAGEYESEPFYEGVKINPATLLIQNNVIQNLTSMLR
ncbi:MAG: tetratricopeptide repeat protein [Candidatus Ozemobacteraceae bacterium]